MNDDHSELTLNICLLYSEIMAKNNVDPRDIQRDIHKIGTIMNMDQIIIYQTLTGIFITLNQGSKIKMSVIEATENNFEKIIRAKQALEDFENSTVTQENFYKSLIEINNTNYSFPLAIQVLSAGVVSAALGVVFTSQLSDFLINLIIGGVSYFILLYFQKKLMLKSFSTFLSASVLAILVSFSINLDLATNPYMIIFSCIMPLVPGIEIVNSIRSVLENNYLIATSQILEALMITIMILMPITFFLNILT